MLGNWRRATRHRRRTGRPDAWPTAPARDRDLAFSTPRPVLRGEWRSSTTASGRCRIQSSATSPAIAAGCCSAATGLRPSSAAGAASNRRFPTARQNLTSWRQRIDYIAHERLTGTLSPAPGRRREHP
ncbi:hypothetical protein ACPA9J_05435 [Pseudomonas aeruginosa]